MTTIGIITTILLALSPILSAWLLWVFYVAVMRLKMLRDVGLLTTSQKVFGYPTLIVGLLLDLVFHVIIGTILFRELPREWTLSGRLWRLSKGKAGWRQRLALWFRVQFLDSIDPAGEHQG